MMTPISTQHVQAEQDTAQPKAAVSTSMWNNKSIKYAAIGLLGAAATTAIIVAGVMLAGIGSSTNSSVTNTNMNANMTATRNITANAALNDSFILLPKATCTPIPITLSMPAETTANQGYYYKTGKDFQRKGNYTEAYKYFEHGVKLNTTKKALCESAQGRLRDFHPDDFCV